MDALPHFDVRTYGAVGDAVTDDTDAIQAAIDAAAPVYGTVVIPPSTHIFSTLDVPKSVMIWGCGTAYRAQPGFGHAWFHDLTYISGSVLRSTATTGKAISVVDGPDNRDGKGVRFADFALIGPGSGTSIGLALGHPDDSGGIVRAQLARVVIGNFDMGAYLSVMNSVFNGLFVGGCNTGIHGGPAHNGNALLAWHSRSLVPRSLVVESRDIAAKSIG